MFWGNDTNKLAGVVLLVAPVLIVVGFLVGAVTGELDPFAQDDLEEMLELIHDNRALYVLSVAAFIAIDAIVLVAAAALLYLAFRDRSRPLALIGAFGMLVATGAFLAHDAAVLTLAFLADDFMEAGGPGGVASGDASILQTARAVSILQGLVALTGQTAAGIGFASFGVLIAWAPEGDRNPPRWLGLAGFAGGLGLFATWLLLVNHTAGGFVTLLAELGVIVMVTGLGVWFLRRPD
jgi:hypothetical protein